MLLVPGPGSKYLAAKIAVAGGFRLADVEYKRFPDGEHYLRLASDFKDEKPVLVNGLHPPQDEHLMHLALLADILKGRQAEYLTAVIPYMAYARQDRRFREGEPISILTVLRMMAGAGIDQVVTVNIHSPWIISQSPIKIIDLDASGLLATYLLQAGFERPYILSPGKKGGTMAEEVASILETSYGVIRSSRDPVTGEVEVSTDAELAGEDVAIVDDVISTGTTMAKSVQLVKKLGAKRVAALCIHGLFLQDSASKIIESGADLLIATDTVPNGFAVASVAGLLAQKLGEI
ncbi:Ribose-phosphate pyrophosphokinase [archaeon HR01]|nr:Ribose-phosphate pyrophosphokinase [archaeon HR01]